VHKIFSIFFALAFAAVVATWVAGCSGESRQARPSRTLVYADAIQAGGPGLVDVYEPPASSESDSVTVNLLKRPAIMAIHGGAWESGGRYQLNLVAAQFAQEGYVVFVPDYSLAPAVEWPAPLLDLQSCLRFMRSNADNLGIDATKIGAWGGSAGGHLATMLALRDDPVLVGSTTTTTTGSGASTTTTTTGSGSSTTTGSGGTSTTTGSGGSGSISGGSITTTTVVGGTSEVNLESIVVTQGRVRAAVDAFGPADLTIPNGMAPNEDQILTNFLGAPFAQLSTSRLLDASTISYARPDASVLILHGTADTFVSIENSQHLSSALTQAKADVQFIQVPGGGHNDTTFHAPEAWSATLQFFQQRIPGATRSDTSTSLQTTSTSPSPSSGSSTSSSSSSSSGVDNTSGQ